MRKDLLVIILLLTLSQYYFFLFVMKHEPGVPLLRGDIAIIDRQRVLKELPAVVGIRSVLDAHLRECQKTFMEKEEALRKDYQDIVGAEASPQDYKQALSVEEKRKVFKEAVLAAQRAADTARKKIQDAYEKVMDRIQKRFTDIVHDLAQERQLECVLDQGQVVYYSTHKDLTDIMLERLSEATKDIKLEVS